jgi:hypothetical protein
MGADFYFTFEWPERSLNFASKFLMRRRLWRLRGIMGQGFEEWLDRFRRPRPQSNEQSREPARGYSR